MSIKNPRAAAALLLCVATVGHARGSLAREPAIHEEASEAEDGGALVTRGIALRRAGEDARALEVFQQAERQEPGSARILVHLAATHQALGHWEDADRYLSRALKDPEDPYVQRHQGTLAAARRVIDGHLGSLQLSGSPRGAEIRLNGRLVGKLPIEETVRVQAGIYTLEARLPGHYPVTRSVALASGALVRESIELAPLSSSGGAAGPADASPSGTSGPSWLTWTFAGIAVAGGVGTVAAWATREQHADAWNDDAECLRPNQTREEACRDERVSGERAERWMYIGAAVTGAATVGAVVSALLNRGAPQESSAALRCGVGLAELNCAGTF